MDTDVGHPAVGFVHADVDWGGDLHPTPSGRKTEHATEPRGKLAVLWRGSGHDAVHPFPPLVVAVEAGGPPCVDGLGQTGHRIDGREHNGHG